MLLRNPHNTEDCRAVSEILQRVGDKWTVLVVGKLGENVHGAFAYGSRGLLWAALAAELIACELEGEPLPVEGKLADALSPARFARRAAARGSRPSRP